MAEKMKLPEAFDGLSVEEKMMLLWEKIKSNEERIEELEKGKEDD